MTVLERFPMRKTASATAAVALILAATLQPSEAFFSGLLSHFFQPHPIVGIQTYAEPTAIGTAYVNAVPFNTPPAPDCLQRALGLLNGCQPFLNALNANGGQLTKFTVFQILQLAIVNKTADVTCYNAAANFLNGGCICDNGLIATINVLNTVPAFAKQAITSLNKAKCPPSPPPPPVSPFPTAGTPPSATGPPVPPSASPLPTPVPAAPPTSVNVAIGTSPTPSSLPVPAVTTPFPPPPPPPATVGGSSYIPAAVYVPGGRRLLAAIDAAA